MDRFLYSLEQTFHLRLVETPADGNCLFHAASLALPRGMSAARSSHTAIRAAVVGFLHSKKEHFAAFQVDDAYLQRMSRGGSWGGEPELVALSNIYMRSVEVYMFSPTGSAVHVRTYTPALGFEVLAPMRLALLPVSGKLGDAPNHYSYLEVVETVLGVPHVPSVPAPPVEEVDLSCDEPMASPMEEDEVLEVHATAAAVEEEVVVVKPQKKTKVSYYKLYEHNMHVLGMDQACADLAARGEVAWYGCECGDCHRRAAFGSDVWAKIVCNEAEVKTTCKVWKPWSLYQTVVRPRLGL